LFSVKHSLVTEECIFLLSVKYSLVAEECIFLLSVKYSLVTEECIFLLSGKYRLLTEEFLLSCGKYHLVTDEIWLLSDSPEVLGTRFGLAKLGFTHSPLTQQVPINSNLFFPYPFHLSHNFTLYRWFTV
jgi:hypothetical protein